jgi:NitT/TauT family transport system ATP-binding protein
MKEEHNMYIEIDNVSKVYKQNAGGMVKALDGASLNISKGEFVCLLGPSGCGKTTLLNLIAGFEKPASGQIKINGKEVKEPSIKNVTIFQNYGLLPWRTVQGNVELGLESQGYDKKTIKRIAKEHIELVGLKDFREDHPHQLSGGMQQRVAIARALAVDPDIMFMDEPFGALDAMTRMKMQDEISSIWEKKKKTILFVTHDIDESVFLADRIVIMTPYPGKIKSIINVPLTRKRDRTHADYLAIRDKVFAEFKLKEKDSVEYYL